MMRRWVRWMLVILMLLNVAAAEPVQLWNGVRFGMTREEVAAVETLPAAGQDRFGPGMVMDVKNSTVTYGYDEAGCLQVVTVRFPDRKSSTLVRGDYDDVHKLLKNAYGKRLKKKDAKLWNAYGPAFTALKANKKLMKSEGANIWQEEWVLPTDEGRVKVDHFCSFVTGRVTDNSHVLEYTLFLSETEAESSVPSN